MARKLEVEIIGDASSLRKAVGQADSSTGKLGKSFGGLGKTAALAAGGAGIAAVGFAVHDIVSDMLDGQKVSKQTDAVLKSTGKSAHVSAKQVGELANSLAHKSGMDDEAIQSGENLLLTFTNIRNEAGKGNDIFTQTTQIMTDMSAALGQDTKSSAIQLGKALNDPVKGITALQRVGVSFTKGQKDTIKTLEAHGKHLQAQKLILHELNKEFGGSAEAMGKTLPGQINIAKMSLENWTESIVTKTIPIVKQMIGWLKDHWPEIQAAIQNFWTSVQPALTAFMDLVVSIAGLIQKHWGTIQPIIEKVAAVFKANMQIITNTIKILVDIIHGDWAKAWTDFKNLMRSALDFALAIFRLFMATTGALAKKAGAALVSAFVNELKALPGQAWAAISALGGLLARKAGQLAGWGADIGKHLLSGIKDGLVGIGAYIVGLVRSAINSLIGRVNRLLEFDFKVKGIGFHVNPPDIPPLATGGIVTKPTLALVGEKGPEAVVPLGRGGAAAQTINVVLDGKVLASVLYDPFRNVLIQKGRGGAVLA